MKSQSRKIIFLCCFVWILFFIYEKIESSSSECVCVCVCVMCLLCACVYDVY